MSGIERFRPMARGPSFSLRNRLERVAWKVVWLLFARPTPPPLHRWRRLLLRLFGARIGTGAVVHAGVRVWLPRNLDIGAGALIGPRAHLYNQGRITIGDHAVISQDAHICASTHRVHDPRFELVARPIVIGRACWVAAEAFVGPGVRMGDGSVLGARGALFEDSEALGIYRGNPASRVGTRDFARTAQSTEIESSDT